LNPHPEQPTSTGRTAIDTDGLSPFITRRVIRLIDGTEEVWQSRSARKQSRNPTEKTWWAPGALGWWLAVLFAIGSACFAIAAIPPVASALGASSDNLLYFVGSLFFTTAGLLQYAEVAGIDQPGLVGFKARAHTLITVDIGRIDWVAATIQSLGTLFFNISTGHALAMSAAQPDSINHAVWRPDAFGSICFLVSSYLSWAEVCHGPGRIRPRGLSWWITTGNLVGSIAFGVSAIASKVLADGDLRSATWTALGTFIGGLCFLGASLLLLPERTEAREGGPVPLPRPE